MTIPRILLIRVLNHFVINFIGLKLSCRSWEVNFDKKLPKLVTHKLTSCNVKIVFASPVRVKYFFTFKDRLPNTLLPGLFYKYKCGRCYAIYYDKTKGHFKVRICERLVISHLTGKKVKVDNNKLTAIQEHFLCCKYPPFFEDFSILPRKSNQNSN